jgi:plasmid stabilization system protein ParE
MLWRVILKKSCRNDLRSIRSFIQASNGAAARRVQSKLVQAALSLDSMPHRGVELEADRSVRRLTCGHYRILYHLNEKKRLVEVIRVWDTRQYPAFHVRESGHRSKPQDRARRSGL